MRHVAWLTSLRHALRVPKEWESSFENKSDKEFMKSIEVDEYTYTLEEQLNGYLSNDELKEVLDKTNKQTACLKLQSNHFKELKLNGLMDDFRHIEFKNIIQDLFDLLSHPPFFNRTLDSVARDIFLVHLFAHTI